MRRRVLIVSPNLFRWGLMGAGSRIMQLSKAWSEIGWDATALVCWKELDARQWEVFQHALPGGLISPPRASFDIIDRACSTLRQLSRTRLLRGMISPSVRRRFRSADTERWAKTLGRHLAKGPAELRRTLESADCIWCVFNGTMEAAAAARTLARTFNKPLVVAVHDPLARSADAQNEEAAYVDFLRSADRLVTTTEAYRTVLHASYGIANEVMDTIHMRFPPAHTTIRTATGVPTADKPLMLAHSGHLDGRHGARDILPLLTALRNWTHAESEQPVDWQLHIAGIGNGLASAGEFVRADHALAKRVIFHGRLSKTDAMALAQRVHINIILQGRDHFLQLPNKVFDLLPLKQPVLGLVPKGSEVCSILAESGRAFLAEPDDLREISAALNSIADRSSLQSKMETGIPASLLAKFSLNSLPGQLAETMDRAILLHSARLANRRAS